MSTEPPFRHAGWQTVRIPFSAFAPVFRARTMVGCPPLNKSNICSLQLMLRLVGSEGPGGEEGRAGGAYHCRVLECVQCLQCLQCLQAGRQPAKPVTYTEHPGVHCT